MARAVCALDLGTTHLKAAVLDDALRVLGSAAVDAPITPGLDAGHELDADAVAAAASGAVRDALARSGIGAADVAALAITNQRATLVPVGADGRACGPALSWQDPRPAGRVDAFAERLSPARFQAICGLPPSTLWSLAKILWLRAEAPGIWARTTRLVLLHDYVLHRLGVDDFVTDPSNASLTGLLDLARLVWSPEILAAADLPVASLPRLAPAGARVGGLSREAAGATGLLAGTPLVVGGGDQQCAALGLGVVEPGQAGVCLGTAAVISCPVARPVLEAPSPAFCTAHVVPGRYVREGIHSNFGSALAWAAGVLAGGDVAKLEVLAGTGHAGALFVPHLSGSGSPDFNARARGAFVGLELAMGPHDLARAAYEGVALELRRILDSLEPQGAISRLVLAGGARHSLVAATLARLCGRELLQTPREEATLVGAAQLAWRGIGREFDASMVATSLELEAVPGPSPSERAAADHLYARYVRCVRAPELSTAEGPEAP
jgi:sugar (pentulose or hexulose) kinase